MQPNEPESRVLPGGRCRHGDLHHRLEDWTQTQAITRQVLQEEHRTAVDRSGWSVRETSFERRSEIL